jgi:hypothetical protein
MNLIMMPVGAAEVLATGKEVVVETEKTDTSHLRTNIMSTVAEVKVLGDTKVIEGMMVEVAHMEVGEVVVLVMKGVVTGTEEMRIDMEVPNMEEEIVMATLDLAVASTQEILTEVKVVKVEEEMTEDNLGAENVTGVIKKGILQESAQKLVNKIRNNGVVLVVVHMEGRVGEMTAARGEMATMLALLETNGEVKCKIVLV